MRRPGTQAVARRVPFLNSKIFSCSVLFSYAAGNLGLLLKAFFLDFCFYLNIHIHNSNTKTTSQEEMLRPQEDINFIKTKQLLGRISLHQIGVNGVVALTPELYKNKYFLQSPNDCWRQGEPASHFLLPSHPQSSPLLPTLK